MKISFLFVVSNRVNYHAYYHPPEYCLIGFVAKFYLDVDYFKNINDTYGHAKGDEVLVQLGELLRNDCRDGDVVARFGGEEFVMLLPQCNAEDASRYAENLRKKISRDYKDNIKITASIGISTFESGKSGNIDSFIASADNALLLAKGHGRDRAVLQEHQALIRRMNFG